MPDIFNMADTWNNAGTTFTAIKMNVTDTASAAGSLLMDLQVGGISKLSVTKTGKLLSNIAYSSAIASQALGDSNGGISFSNGGTFFNAGGSSRAAINHTELVLSSTMLFGFAAGAADAGGPDTVLARDAANTLAQRNGANSQAFHLYNSYTDAANYERLKIRGNAGAHFQIIAEQAGTGASRGIHFGIGGTEIFGLDTSGRLVWITDNTYDIGANGATRPRNLYLGGNVNIGSAAELGFENRASVSSPASDVVRIAKFGGGRATLSLVGLYTVATLPSAANYAASLAFVSDATSTTARSTVVGGGANKVLVMSDGTNWLIVA